MKDVTKKESDFESKFFGVFIFTLAFVIPVISAYFLVKIATS